MADERKGISIKKVPMFSSSNSDFELEFELKFPVKIRVSISTALLVEFLSKLTNYYHIQGKNFNCM